MFKFAMWLGRIDLAQAGLVGIYLSMIPAVYCAMKISESGAGELVLMYSLSCMFGFPTTFFIAIHLIMRNCKNEPSNSNTTSR